MNTLDIPQANERPHRIHQTESCEVYYFGYNDTCQAATAQYVAKKVGVMARFQGDVKTGLAALEDEVDMVDGMQVIVSHREHYESDISVDDLPPLPERSSGLILDIPKPKVNPQITNEKIHSGQVQQLTFF
jgi:hypothetical protein